MNFYISPQKASRIAIVVGMVIIAVAVINFVYWSTSSGDVLEMKSKTIPVRTIREHPTADGVVILQPDYCKKVATTGRVRTSFVANTREEFLPISYERLSPGCYNKELPVLIPRELIPGKYKIKFRIEYQVNPIKRVVEEFTTEEFEVFPP